ncbi:MAG: helix-turn-helix domain-containing protein [Alistipes sp.]|nr:helix-turn-helix domain-containing protein [Alistipes sp.]MBR3892268.1 helix-turn-helix domain-containing protein [Alistipes sp.]
MFALADCKNFYASCERVFRPDLQGRPIIVLSNNDGCAVALQAKLLLRSTKHTIEQIAEELNFSTTPYFCRFFKREVGITPTEYRKKCVTL